MGQAAEHPETSVQLQGGALMIFDKVHGFLNKFLAMLAPRESILLGNILSKFPEIVLTMDRTDWENAANISTSSQWLSVLKDVLCHCSGLSSIER